MNLHRLLKRQIKRHLSDPSTLDSKWYPLLEAISASYTEADRERELMQNALAVNSAELTEVNERLRSRNRELMQTMMNTLSEGVYATDVYGHITFMNLSAEQILGWSEREMIGRRAHDVIQNLHADGSVYPEETSPLLEASKLGHSAAGEDYFIHRDGHHIPVSYRLNPLKQEGRLLGSLVSFRDISDRLKSEERINQLAFFDPLTDLPNRRLLLNRLEQALAVSARQQMFGAVLFIDLDNFKVINDTLGHECGDAVLKETAARLRRELREADTVARLGGDEFVVILEELDADRGSAAAQAKHVGDKILERLCSIQVLNGKEWACSVSIGVVMFHGHDEDIQTILKRSDLAMYDAKKAGRGTLRFFDPAMQLELENRTKLESDLRLAMAEDQFVLHYQKRVSSTGQVTGAEALLRWMHPERGVVPPAQFIRLAEEVGLIVPIGQWVLREACRQLKAWESGSETCGLVISVNVSAREFEREDFVDSVNQILLDTKADASLLELEITESMLLENVEELIGKMYALRKLGISFALDDFGTGYSSLSYLKKLPLHKLKIDQGFIKDLETDKNDEAIVRTIIQIGKTLGLEIIAEGVESNSQSNMLMKHGCHNFQGYLFGKPVPIDRFESELCIPPQTLRSNCQS